MDSGRCLPSADAARFLTSADAGRPTEATAGCWDFSEPTTPSSGLVSSLEGGLTNPQYPGTTGGWGCSVSTLAVLGVVVSCS